MMKVVYDITHRQVPYVEIPVGLTGCTVARSSRGPFA
jgi:hypothetical protein